MVTFENFKEVVEGIMQGAIDMHVHFGPELPPFPERRVARRLDAIQTARQAKEAGMRAIVLKSHAYPTAPVVHVVRQAVPDIHLFGTIALNHSVGGLNPVAVEVAAGLGTKVLFMPTWDSAYQRRQGGREGGISILDSDGKLLTAVHDILEIVKAHRMVLATAHLSPEEQMALVEEASRKGIEKIVVSHVREAITLEMRRRMIALGAVIEHAFLHCLPAFGRADPMIIVEAIKAVGAEHCSIIVDVGHVINPDPADAFRMFVATLLDLGLTEREVRYVAQINPARLLDLD